MSDENDVVKPPPVEVVPLTEQPSTLAWLGTKKFWLGFAGLLFLVFVAFIVWMRNVTDDESLVPVVSLSGPMEAGKNETARYAVLVRDRFGAPIKGATVRVGFFKTGLIELGHATTSDSGDATVEVRFPDDFTQRRSLVAVAEVGVADGHDNITVSPREPGEGRIFVSTDKPLYQPGQTVHVRALIMSGDKPLVNKPVSITIQSPGNNTKIFATDTRTSAFGIVSTDFVLAEQVLLGYYSINVKAIVREGTAGKDGATATTATSIDATERVVYGNKTFEVKRYSLPKLKIALEDVSPFTIESRSVVGTAHASWIFGEPVTKGKLSVSLVDARNDSTLIAQAVGQPNKDGQLHFELAAPVSSKTKPSSQTFKIRARIEVEGGMSAETTQALATSSAIDVKVEAFPESGAFVPGVTQNVYVIASTTSDKKSGIKVHSMHPQPPSATGKTPPPREGPVAETNERGIAVLSVHPDPKDYSKETQIIAFAENGGESSVKLTTSDATLVVRSDRPTYKQGETAKVTVLGASVGDHISVRMTKGAEPIGVGSCPVTNAEAGCDVMMPLPKDAAGLIWLHAMSLPVGRPALASWQWSAEHPVRTGKKLMLVGSVARDLDLKVTPDKKSYTPREVGAIDIDVSQAGGAGPVKAQLGVAIADEAVFALADVRPDLEKQFFTVDKDVQLVRGGNLHFTGNEHWRPKGSSYAVGPFGSVYEHAPPTPYNAATAYDQATPTDVSAVVLAALTTISTTGGFEAADSSSLRSRAADSVDRQKRRVGGWALLFASAISLAALFIFGIYGVMRFRHPQPLEEAQANRELYVRETRSLMIDFLVAFVGPPLLGAAVGFAGEVLNSSGSSKIFGAWFVLGVFCAWLLLRSAFRVRRDRVLFRNANTFKRVLLILPIATLFGHFVLSLGGHDEGERLAAIFGHRRDEFLLGIAIIAASQVSFGFMSVIRQTFLRQVTNKGRYWLLISRACFVGLPFTLIGLVGAAGMYVRNRQMGWDEYGQEEREAEQVADSSSDNKEGGTGTRAKGEEGSMGNPNTTSMNKRFGVQGPRDGKDGVDEERKPALVVRDYFPETLLWAPDIITDDKGHATLKVPFADSITTWRFGLRAVSATGQLGSVTAPLVVKQDFFVEANLPVVLTQGDEIAVPVTVFSYADSAQDVDLELESDGVSAVGGTRAAIHLSPRDARGHTFRIRADKAGERLVKIKAVSAARGDAIERKISITPNGIPMIRTSNGRVGDQAAQSFVELPANAIDGGNDLSIKIYGGPLSQVVEGLDGIFRMPNGCFEQTSSTTYPSILALDFLTKTKTTNPEIEKKARDYINQGYQRLLTFEVSGSSGFSAYGKDPASAILTAYGLLELADMSRVAQVDTSLIERMRSFLMRKRSKNGGFIRTLYDAKEDEKAQDDIFVTAYVVWALATASQTSSAQPTSVHPSAAANPASPEMKSLLEVVKNAPLPAGDDPYALALRANALLAARDDAGAKALLDRLVPQAIRDEHGVHWSSKAPNGGVMYSYGTSFDIEVTGLATHALSRASMQPELRSGALDWMVAQRGAYGTWSTTQATIAAMRALLDDAKPTPTGPQDVTVSVDGEAVETYKMEPKARDVHHLVGLRKFAGTGKHVVEVKAAGGDISYQVVAKHYVPFQKQKDAGLTLDVAYGPTTVPAGGITSCRVRLDWKAGGAGKKAEPALMPLIEVAVPPAFEVESDGLEKILADKKSGIQRYTVERGKVTLYMTSLAEKEPLDIELTLRALRPAKVVVQGSAAYLYYEPEIRSETAPLMLRAN